MALNKNERTLTEAIKSMLQQDAKLGLAVHANADYNPDVTGERGYEYLHNQIDEMFALRASDLLHAEGVCQAFRKVHNYKYLDDPTFQTAMQKEMVAQAIPAEERKRALSFVPAIINELAEERGVWAEKDSFNPYLDEIKDVSKPNQPADFGIHERGTYNKQNIQWKRGEASPSQTPSDK